MASITESFFAGGQGRALAQANPAGAFSQAFLAAKDRGQQAAQFDKQFGLAEQRLGLDREKREDEQKKLRAEMLKMQQDQANQEIDGNMQLVTDIVARGNETGTLENSQPLLEKMFTIMQGHFPLAGKDPEQAQAFFEGAIARGMQLSAGEAARRTAAGSTVGTAQGRQQVAPGITPEQAVGVPESAETAARGRVLGEAGALQDIGISPRGIERGLGVAPPEAAPQQNRAVNVFLPDGTSQAGRIQGGSQIPQVRNPDNPGEWIDAPVGATFGAGTASLTELGSDKVLHRQRIGVETTFNAFLRQGLRTVKRLQDPKFVAGAAGAGLRFAQGLKAQGRDLAQAFTETADGRGGHATAGGQPLSVNQILDPKRYENSGLQEIAGASAEVKADLVGLAYMKARLDDPDGRISDADVDNALKQFGLGEDPEIQEGIILDRIIEVGERSEDFIRLATGDANFRFDELDAVRNIRSDRDASTAPLGSAERPFTLESLRAERERRQGGAGGLSLGDRSGTGGRGQQ